ncbi:unnamed protein product [Allacma fusca]|uniref:Uncharacterized protein n=1 Tax=Allacma fusca TaxID=39272 RepID=A0A8J2J8E0_9HEXA|nr:unnamed protein product [Allacma fusca]
MESYMKLVTEKIKGFTKKLTKLGAKRRNWRKRSSCAGKECLIPVFSCDGWRISTVESLGNRKTGYSKIQLQLVNFGGTHYKCGYSTPGMITSMNSISIISLMEEKAMVKTKHIENLLDGNAD